LGFSPGTEYGAEGKGFQRINIACPNQTIELALKRLAKIARYIE
jgi:bifunctional pyridoxal-dependent enzyme with beta-cystathionase and maltose regulon repressor activities